MLKSQDQNPNNDTDKAKAHNFEQISSKIASSEPILPLWGLKTLETKLAATFQLSIIPGQLFNPLWFLAETERDIYLWRKGLSIKDKDSFEFLIAPLKLIEKRQIQLSPEQIKSKGGRGNPFLNPVLDLSSSNLEICQSELEYLHELSCIITEICQELRVLALLYELLSDSEKTRVILPFNYSSSQSPNSVTHSSLGSLKERLSDPESATELTERPSPGARFRGLSGPYL